MQVSGNLPGLNISYQEIAEQPLIPAGLSPGSWKLLAGFQFLKARNFPFPKQYRAYHNSNKAFKKYPAKNNWNITKKLVIFVIDDILKSLIHDLKDNGVNRIKSV